jgi:hypothetical protein
LLLLVVLLLVVQLVLALLQEAGEAAGGRAGDGEQQLRHAHLPSSWSVMTTTGVRPIHICGREAEAGIAALDGLRGRRLRAGGGVRQAPTLKTGP